MADRAASDRSLLIAIDALLRSGRVEAAISVLERELVGGTMIRGLARNPLANGGSSPTTMVTFDGNHGGSEPGSDHGSNRNLGQEGVVP